MRGFYTNNNMQLTDLTEEYSRNMGGIRCESIYIAYHSDVLTWPTEPAEGDSPEVLGAVIGNIEMKPGKRFFEFRATEETGELRYSDQGEIDGMSQRQELEVFHPQMKSKLIGFIEATNNAKLVLIVADREGAHYIMGSQYLSAYRIAGSGTLGKVTADRKGATIMFACNGHSPARRYSGAIPLEEASS